MPFSALILRLMEQTCLCCVLRVILMASMNLNYQPPKSTAVGEKTDTDRINKRCRPTAAIWFLVKSSLTSRCSDHGKFSK